MEFNRVGIIDVYKEIQFEPLYDNHSNLTLTLEGNKKYMDLLVNADGRIVTKSTDIATGYFIETVQFVDGKESEIILYARSLSVMTSWRTIAEQQVYNGNVEDVMKSFVNANMINPKNVNRKIPDLVLGVNTGIDITTEEAFTEIELDVALWEMCNKHEMSFEILMNHDAKKYVFNTYRGLDRTTEQSVNDRVIFTKAFDNVMRQSYVDDNLNYRSTAVVVGIYEEEFEQVAYANDEISGFARREIFVDARDIDSIWTNEDDVDISMTESQYDAVLVEQGLSRLSEYQRIQTFESDIDVNSKFTFGVDYELGDKVTTRNDELGIVMHQRVVGAVEIYNRSGYSLQLTFGTAIPTLLDKIKREVK